MVQSKILIEGMVPPLTACAKWSEEPPARPFPLLPL